ncbi:MAG: hypothetical protein ABR915_15855 [Thermoguttaceae bacterium]
MKPPANGSGQIVSVHAVLDTSVTGFVVLPELIGEGGENKWTIGPDLGKLVVQAVWEALKVFVKHLKAHLQLPCEVTGTEDFRWEEPYVIGGWSQQEYKRLKKTQPSYTDKYELLEIERGWRSEWMMFEEDTVAHVRRKSDGKEFDLGLAELRVTDKKSPNFQLIDDYAVWLVNNR